MRTGNRAIGGTKWPFATLIAASDDESPLINALRIATGSANAYPDARDRAASGESRIKSSSGFKLSLNVSFRGSMMHLLCRYVSGGH